MIPTGAVSAAWLLGAGVLAGVIGTAGGITSLVSYPALLATGLGPVQANVTNLVAALACWPGSALASRRELSGKWAQLRIVLPVAAIGGAAGAITLLITPGRAFTLIVPYLVLLGSVIVLVQPALTRRFPPRGIAGTPGETGTPGRTGTPGETGSPGIALTAVGAASVYGGYFGAGSGILLLATALALVDPRLPQANALKNMLVGAGALTATVIFALTGPVAWSAVAPLAVGLFAGSTLGPALTRRLPDRVVRLASALIGLVLAVELWRG